MSVSLHCLQFPINRGDTFASTFSGFSCCKLENKKALTSWRCWAPPSCRGWWVTQTRRRCSGRGGTTSGGRSAGIQVLTTSSPFVKTLAYCVGRCDEFQTLSGPAFELWEWSFKHFQSKSDRRGRWRGDKRKIKEQTLFLQIILFKQFKWMNYECLN